MKRETRRYVRAQIRYNPRYALAILLGALSACISVKIRKKR